MDMGPIFGTFLQLLVLTGQRREEVAALKWSELDRAERQWQLPAKRAKNGNAHMVPLNQPAINILDLMAGGDRWPKKGYVFSTTGKTPISGFSRAKRRLDKIVAKLAGQDPVQPWRLHDLRRTVATEFQKLGIRFEVTEAVLNHISGSKSGVAAVYQRYEWAPEKRVALDRWAVELMKMMDAFLGRDDVDWAEKFSIVSSDIPARS